MCRRRGDTSAAKIISEKVPDIGRLQKLILIMSPDFIASSHLLLHESTVPQAAVSLRSVEVALTGACYALSEAYSRVIWYRKQNPPQERLAIFLGRFYADDVALRLYTAGEHLADAIINMLEIDKQRISPYKEKKISLQSAVVAFMRKEMSEHPIWKAIEKLGDLPNYQKTLEYRGDWVHKQPPTIAGLGEVFKKGNRWREIKERGVVVRRELYVGGGDKPDYSVDELLDLVQPAVVKFAETAAFVSGFYEGILSDALVTYNIKASRS